MSQYSSGLPSLGQMDQGQLLAPRVNWWLRLTSAGWDRPQQTIEQREMVRRSRLTAWIILGLLISDVLLIPAGSGDASTLVAVVVAGVGIVIAAGLNRGGFVTAAGILLVLLICGAIIGALASGPLGLELVDLPAFDLLAIAVVVAASVLPRMAAFIVAGLNIGLICADFFLEPQAPDLRQATASLGALALLARPVALQVVIATVAFLWVRGTDAAIRRADRAEEIAAIEHHLAEQKRQLDVGIQQILETHVRVANGDFAARAPLSQDNILFQIAASLNNLLNRLGRAGQAEYLYQRTVAEIARLRDSLQAAKSGRAPLWPAPSGTPVDELIQVIAGPVRGGATAAGGQLPQTTPSGPSSGPWSAPASTPGLTSNPWRPAQSSWPPQASGRAPEGTGALPFQGPPPESPGWGGNEPAPSSQVAPFPTQTSSPDGPWDGVSPGWPPPGDPFSQG